MKDIKTMVVVVAATIGTLCGFAQGTVSLAPLGGTGAAAQPAAAESDTVKVQSRGVGLNKNAALKDAYRDAIERAVGLYVDAETAVSNDELIKDQVLTQSNAYITDYRELGEEKLDGGLVQLRILATVKKVALTTKLTGVMPPQTVRIDNSGLQNVHAELVTKKKRAEDAAALLKNALDGIDPIKSLMVASIRPETQKILTGDTIQMNNQPLLANQVLLRYLFEVKLDRAKYFAEFVPNLKKVLDQISLKPPKEVRLTELIMDERSSSSRRAENFEKFKNGLSLGYNSPSELKGTTEAHSIFGASELNGFFDPLRSFSFMINGRNYVCKFGYDQFRPKTGGSFSFSELQLRAGDFEEHYRKDKVVFALITALNADCSTGKVTIYELDKSAIDILNDWRTGILEKEAEDGPVVQQMSKGSRRIRNRHRMAMKTTNYNIVLLDKDGNEIGVYPWQIPSGILMNVKFAEIPGAGMVYATPFVGCFGENFIQWRDFILQQDDLAKIASVKIELAD